MKNEETWYLVLSALGSIFSKNQELKTKYQAPGTSLFLHSQFFILHSQFFILNSSMNMAFIVSASHSRALFIQFAQHIQNQVGVAHGVDVLLKLDC